jgi:hypothetical protein
MADETMKFIRVYEKDADRLNKLYGSPQWRAFRIALAKTGCDHPEGLRTYTSAIIDAQIPGKDIKQNSKVTTLSGFYCGACGRYVFPDPNYENKE